MWLMPKPGASRAIGGLIRALSHRHGTPLFAPHVTLLGSINADRREVLRCARGVAAAAPPIRAGCRQVAGEDVFYRCLYVRLAEGPALMRAARLARRCFAPSRPRPPYMPHLSLMYGSINQEEKTDIIASLAEEPAGAGLELATLAVYSTSGAPEDWAEVESLKLTG